MVLQVYSFKKYFISACFVLCIVCLMQTNGIAQNNAMNDSVYYQLRLERVKDRQILYVFKPGKKIMYKLKGVKFRGRFKQISPNGYMLVDNIIERVDTVYLSKIEKIIVHDEVDKKVGYIFAPLAIGGTLLFLRLASSTDPIAYFGSIALIPFLLPIDLITLKFLFIPASYKLDDRYELKVNAIHIIK